jgi:amino-acid N-acetyltransferase
MTKSIRNADRSEAPALHALIESHRIEGHLLPRSLAELEVHADRFVVIEERLVGSECPGKIIACAELMKLSSHVAEVRSLVVDREHRGGGVAAELMSALVDAARDAGYLSLCAFTHSPAFFVRQGFSIVPHTWVPEKIKADCTSCAFFRRCEQYAMLLPLDLMAGAYRQAPDPRPGTIAASAA